MVPVQVEGVRRNFLPVSAFLYNVFLMDGERQRLLTFGIERHEALPIVAVLNDFTLPRPEAINSMAGTLQQLGYTLEEARIESHSMLPPSYNLCECRLYFRKDEILQEQTRTMRPGDAIGLALLMNAPISISDELFEQAGVPLTEKQTPELVFAVYLLDREGIAVPEGQDLRLGFSKTPARDALVKECKAAISGKAPIFPEEDIERRKQEYLAFLLR